MEGRLGAGGICWLGRPVAEPSVAVPQCHLRICADLDFPCRLRAIPGGADSRGGVPTLNSALCKFLEAWSGFVNVREDCLGDNILHDSIQLELKMGVIVLWYEGVC